MLPLMSVRICSSIVLFVLCALFAGCQPAPRQAEARPAELRLDAVNQTARFLAGIPGDHDGLYRDLERDPTWKEYAAQFDRTWKNNQEKQISPVRSFYEAELQGKLKHDVVFYPFSGPDVLYMRAFFPHGKTYVMAGLEPAGTLGDPERYGDDLPKHIEGWRAALASIFRRSFFVTSEMEKQARGRVFDGLVPIMAMLLARSGHHIDSIRYLKLQEDGTVVDEGPLESPKDKRRAVEIRFHLTSDNVPRRLYYFSTDLAEGLEKNPAFLHFVRGLGRADTFVKSASFLLHWRMCREMRDFILSNSDTVLQDDTGIKYKLYDPEQWDVTLYGEYSRPDPPFTKEYQADLAAAFDSGERVRPMRFALGYGYGRRPSSLILSVRNPGSVSSASPAPRKPV